MVNIWYSAKSADAEGEGGGVNWEIGVDICTPPCIKQVTNENLLCSTGSSVQCPAVTSMGRESNREQISEYRQLTHCVLQQKLTQHCIATMYPNKHF